MAREQVAADKFNKRIGFNEPMDAKMDYVHYGGKGMADHLGDVFNSASMVHNMKDKLK